MVVRLNDIAGWNRLNPGLKLALPSEEPRKVRLEVNCPAPTRIDALVGGVVHFLAVVQGYEVIEFGAPGVVEVVLDSELETYYRTDDGESIAVVLPDNEPSFTTPMERQVRNPHLEAIEFKMRQNMLAFEERMGADRAALEARLVAAEARAKAAEGKVDAVGLGGPGRGDPAGEPDAAGAAGSDAGAEQQPAPVPSPKPAKGKAADGAA